MDFPPLAFVDTETTGLDADRHEIWEVGLITRSNPVSDYQEYSWQLPVDLGRADPIALKIGGFHERRASSVSLGDWRGSPLVDAICLKDKFARDFARLTRGKHLVGAVISFDEERLRKLLRANGACPEWHYHLVDVEAMAAGRLGVEPPWDSKELSARVGVDNDQFRAHEALEDARWAKAIYEQCTKPRVVSAPFGTWTFTAR